MLEITYTNSRGTSIKLGQVAPFFIQKLEGFSNVDNVIHTVRGVNQDGSTETGNNLDIRHLTIEGEFIGSDRQRQRERLIKAFNPKYSGILTYKRGDTIRKIECRPEHSPVLPSSQLSTGLFMINLQASDPYWLDMTEIREDVSTLEGSWQFPWGIPAEGYEVAIRTISFVTNIYNASDVDVPVRIEIEATGTVENPAVINLATGEFIRVKRTLGKGDRLEINTAFGNKRVEITRSNGDVENVFHWIDYKSTFFTIESGDTEVEYGADVGDNNLDVYIYYTQRYLGV